MFCGDAVPMKVCRDLVIDQAREPELDLRVHSQAIESTCRPRQRVHSRISESRFGITPGPAQDTVDRN